MNSNSNLLYFTPVGIEYDPSHFYGSDFVMLLGIHDKLSIVMDEKGKRFLVDTEALIPASAKAIEAAKVKIEVKAISIVEVAAPPPPPKFIEFDNPAPAPVAAATPKRSSRKKSTPDSTPIKMF